MNRNIITIIIVAIVVLVIVVVGIALYQQSITPATESTDGSNQTEPTPTNGNASPDTPVSSSSVEIRDFAFSPSDITVEQGTTITWTNQDDVGHNVIAADENNAGGLPTDAPLLSQGESYSFTFNELGTFAYRCQPHPDMQGTVTVIE